MTLTSHRHALPKSAPVAQSDAKSSVQRKKDDLRGKSFAEQEAALAPPENALQMKGKGPTIGSRSGAKADAGATKTESKNADLDKASETGKPGRARAPLGSVAHAEAHDGAISAVPSAEALALGKAILESDDPALAPYKALTLYEVVSLYRYSTNDAYPINRVLRGIDTDPELVAVCMPIADAAGRALKKLADVPRASLLESVSEDAGAKEVARQVAEKQRKYDKKTSRTLGAYKRTKKGKRTKQELAAHEQSQKAKDGKSVSHVFRAIDMKPGFESVFATYSRGATLEERGFISTSTTASAYRQGGTGVRWRVWDPTGGKSIAAISHSKAENEVLFPPGTKLVINDLRYAFSRGQPKGTDHLPQGDSVASPQERFKLDDRSPLAWNDAKTKTWTVDLTLVPPTESKQEDNDDDYLIEEAERRAKDGKAGQPA